MSVGLVVAKVGVSSVVSYLKAMADPGKRRLLEEQKDEHVLSELPRIIGLLEDRCADLEARGCTPVEANIIAHQVIEAQKRTLDEEKRHRLTNVLVNGLSAEHWDKATHRLMVRLASDLEEEHIERLRRHDLRHANHAIRERDRQASEVKATRASLRRAFDHDAVVNSLERELIALGLLEEVRGPRPFAKPTTVGKWPDDHEYAAKDMQTSNKIARLGEMFLDYLRDPAEPEPIEP